MVADFPMNLAVLIIGTIERFEGDQFHRIRREVRCMFLVSPSQHTKVDLKPLIVSVIPIYSLSDTINLFCFLFFILINKLITFSAS